MTQKITSVELHKKFIYLAQEGLLIHIRLQKIVGTLNKSGYLLVTINGKNYLVHRVVYCMYHGYWPENDIDHINHIPNDNRICNLREVSRSCNIKNAKLSKTNTSGIKGVAWHKNRNCWIAHIKTKHGKTHIGAFKYFINAVKARSYAEQKFGYNICDHNSTATEYLKRLENFSKIKIITNIEIEEPIRKKTIENEWQHFCYTNKKKIDRLTET